MTRPGIREYVLLLLLAGMWGSSFTFIKIGVHAYSPLVVAGGRLTFAALVLWGFAWVRKSELPKGKKAWISTFFIALIGNAIPFFLISYGETQVDAGLAAILMSTVPLTAVVLAHFFTADEKLTLGKVVGIILGTIGVVVLVGPETLSGLGGEFLFQLAILIAAVGYAVSSLITRNLRDQPRIGSTAVILTFASLMLMPFTLILDQPWTMTWDVEGALSIMYLGVFPTGIAMFLILQLVAAAGTSFLVFNNYLVPAVGVLISFLVLGEVPQPTAILAMVIILTGIAASQVRFTRKSLRVENSDTQADPIAPVLEKDTLEKSSQVSTKSQNKR
ncbi:MAG: EamA family transporter [Thalassospira sp.]|uniref:DMT family transporter n=1 Tax=Thalassospira sp. GB04J01 TaxID=1485225 RepID=UPI000C0E5EB3|nr:EamA family transporter [Thalassospira sp. GB04J01]MBV16055.1 EamA family transporter [Thalassospira sp.]|tara:strand:+ start:26573 stop:27568 length:996 start_codon:yes stop_codon:yes gene_type:complete